MYTLFILNLAQEQNRAQNIFVFKNKRNTFKDEQLTISCLLPLKNENIKATLAACKNNKMLRINI